MENLKLDINVMLDSLTSRIAQLEKEKAVLIAQVKELKRQNEGGSEIMDTPHQL